MRYYLILGCYFLYAVRLSAQDTFHIIGSTNFVNAKKAILQHDALECFFGEQKTDTVPIINNNFTFKGKIKYPLQCRLSIIDDVENKHYMSEPFFIDTGVQKISMNIENKLNSTFDFGYGILLYGSVTHDEYIEKYLTLYNAVNQETKIFFSKLDNLDTIKNEIIKNKVLIELENERERLRGVRDSILFSYALKYPNSNILSWFLNESLRRYGYKEIYQNVFANFGL